tara:strand:+ start:1133 stop:1345 length:213 start_codon:yes stop_codon:yes gene_type:complete
LNKSISKIIKVLILLLLVPILVISAPVIAEGVTKKVTLLLNYMGYKRVLDEIIKRGFFPKTQGPRKISSH